MQKCGFLKGKRDTKDNGTKYSNSFCPIRAVPIHIFPSFTCLCPYPSTHPRNTQYDIRKHPGEFAVLNFKSE